MQHALLICIAFVCSFSFLPNEVNAQSKYMQWAEKPVLHNTPEIAKNSSAVVLKDLRLVEYTPNNKDEVEVTSELKRLIKVLDDKGVESFNKIYVRIASGAYDVEVKARAILPDGRVVVVPQDKILDVEEEGKKYKKFAMEGVVTGSEVEYYVKQKFEVFTFGMEYYMFGSSPTEEAWFGLSVPDHLYFDVKGYNGFTVEKDTVIDKQRLTFAHASGIVPFKEEQYSSSDPHIPNVQYKLSYNYAQDKNVRLNTWNNLARNVYNNYHVLSDKESKAIDNFMKQMKLPKNASTEEKIAFIEHYIKSNIVITDSRISEDADNLEVIVKTKVAREFGAIRLMIGVLEKAGLKTSVVFPSKRDDSPIDESFENFRLLNDVLLYFPETEHFLDPIGLQNRYPVFDPYWGGTQGLFINETEIGGFKSGLYQFDTIPLMPFEYSSTNMETHLKFNKERDSLILDTRQILTGYSAIPYRSIYSFLETERHDDFTKNVVSNISKSDSVHIKKVENKELTNTLKNKPLIISATITSSDLLEVAGKNILLKIGETIGTQVQMYEDKDRQLPIIIQYPHALIRDIELDIPDGFTIKNPDDLRFEVLDGKTIETSTMGFISTYTIKGKKLTVHINEFYKAIYYPKENIDMFRKVINAAADFNKVTLVLEKL